MATVVIAEEIRSLLADRPLPGHAVEWLSGASPTPTGAYDALVPLLSRAVGDHEFEGLPDLAIVANCAVGVDNVDLAAAARRGVVVTNTPGVLTESTADLTWALLLAVARRVREGMDLVQRGAWEGWHPTQLLGLELNGATIGVVGAGRIGQAVARRALGFGMRVLYVSREAKPAFEAATGAHRCTLDALLADADVVTLHVPSSDETRGMLGREQLSRMRRGALLINTARGDVVDEAALVAALDTGHLGGAGLDVFREEPSVPGELRRHPRVVALPHLGSATTVTRRAMAQLAIDNVAAVLSGRAPLTPVTIDGDLGSL
jgi:glyoxylate reductase